jgi:uncharacterized phage protein (TIGR01671 family)
VIGVREIKFRALDTKGHFVYGLPYYTHGNGDWYITHSNGWLPSYGNPDEGESTEWTTIDPDTIGQYTGIKDVNGCEIYEGDLLKSTLNSHYWIYVVKHLGGQFGDMLFSVPIEDNVSTTCDEDGRGRYTFEPRKVTESCRSYVDRKGEIIGNIHQNPEMLVQFNNGV